MMVKPMVKRNLTPDEHLKPPATESYLLVDGYGQPKKIYIKRNQPMQQQASQTIDYGGDYPTS